MKIQEARPLRILPLILWALVLWGVQYARRDFWEPDEARYVYVAHEMQQSGQWLMPQRHGLPYAHKPPLMFWLINAGQAVAGPTAATFGARLPSLLGVVLSLWAISGLGTLWAGAAVGRRAVAVTSTAWLFWQVGGMGQIDALLTGLELTAVFLLVRNDRSPRRWQPWTAFTLMGLGILAKGPVGLVVPLGIYVVAACADGGRPRLRAWQWVGGLMLALAFPAAWLLACWLDGAPSTYLRELVFTQNVSRAAGELGHRKPFFYFLGTAPVDFLPWTLFVPAAYLWLGVKDRALRRRLTAWFAFVLLLFSMSASKRNLYILSAYPAAALAIAATWEQLEASRACRRVALGLLGLLATAAPLAALAIAHPEWWVRWVRKLADSGVMDSVPWWPFAIVGIPATVALALLLRRGRTRWLDGYALALAGTLVVVGGAVLPAFDAVKTPVAIRAIAKQYVPEEGHLLLFGIYGEILALYANRMGERVDTPEALKAAMRQQRRGVAVFLARDGRDVKSRYEGIRETGSFHMGSKEFIWFAFDVAGGSPESNHGVR